MSTLHPIAVVEQVIEEYRSYLRTEFRARDEKLRQDLEDGLDRARFLAQEPFFQAYRPFKSGGAWTALGLDARLAEVMRKRSGSDTAYLHQSEAIRHLLDPEEGPLAVTTGTGSGKTECFLLPVIQNAIADATAFKPSGLTAILVYPMNALANDQEQRILEYLGDAGHDYVRVARYDRSTSEKQRAELRSRPPHILLTNYVMLEYLLVRPADREALFKNHRCRFTVLDEVHTYRGSLGANIALLCRRLRAHLKHSEHDWNVDSPDAGQRFPKLRFIATSATIKSVDETHRSQEEQTRLRREAVQHFVESISGEAAHTIRVIGEERARIAPPASSQWASMPPRVPRPNASDSASIQKVVAALAGLPDSTPIKNALGRARIFWVLGELLSQRPRSVTEIAERIRSEVPERRDCAPEQVRHEVQLALDVGATLGDADGSLRLRVHRFIRGGWRFHRCLDPHCGCLYPMGEGTCQCGHGTAPLLLCRSCGADALHFWGDEDNPEKLEPYAVGEGQEWVLYDTGRHAIEGDDTDEEDGSIRPKGRTTTRTAKKLKGRMVLEGSFEPSTSTFSADGSACAVKVALAPARNRCLVCGGSGGARSIMTSVALGTSAALRVLAEGVVEGLAREHQRLGQAQSKERALIFADSRQDAAHQARFITYAGRYDRMRRRLVRALEEHGSSMPLEQALRALLVQGLEFQDNPHLEGKRVQAHHLPKALQEKAQAWEEAPLLDDLAVTANYRGTVLNLGLVGVRYGELNRYIADAGQELATELGLSTGQLEYVCRCLLDDMRVHGALSRPLLTYHPASPQCPEQFKIAAEWERRLKRPNGYACTPDGRALGYLDASEIPEGINRLNLWQRSNRGRPPRLQAMFRNLIQRMRRDDPHLEDQHLLRVIGFLREGSLLTGSKLHGFKGSRVLLQVNAEAVELELVASDALRRCSVCNVRSPWAEIGSPCPACSGVLERWPEVEVSQNRYVERIRSNNLMALRAGEHTAQITSEDRMDLETRFKSDKDPLNILACSPTLEMGIDVGGLDAVLMRNVPPRPDNYAQRGGRAGRRTRVGVVLGYARSTPHDQYFYDKPAEMIAGEVAAPAVSLSNRDVIVRHLNAIALGSADPGLAGRMGDYLTLKGELLSEPIDRLIAAFEEQFDYASDLALEAWGPPVLEPAALSSKDKLLAVLHEQPARVRDLFDRVAHQIRELQQRVHQWSDLGVGKWQAMNAMDLSRRLLGLPPGDRDKRTEADDRSAGHPMRRFAEFGLLPGYEFPSEPATLRLLRDRHEEEPITVARRFGLSQYQPDAWAHARGHRWKVVGLDTASPWNPRTDEPQWTYRVCEGCKLRFDAQDHVRCPRCKSSGGLALPGFEFGGFLAVRDDASVLEEEDRFSRAGLLRCYPQWNGDVVGRYELPTRWFMELRKGEDIRWLNEWKAPTKAERESRCILHDEARGFYLCPSCGRLLTPPAEEAASTNKGSKKANLKKGEDAYGHAADCRRLGKRPDPLAITSCSPACSLRILVNLPANFDEEEFRRWGTSLGFSIRTGMRQLYMLDGSELEFELEGPWRCRIGEAHCLQGSLTFIDPALGGAGFLEQAAREFHLVARRARDHLEHADCDTACYRCLKSYQNQRMHELLSWPHALPDLDCLATAPPREIPARVRDKFNARAWLEAYDAGVGSPLELKFLRLLEARGIQVEKQVPIGLEDGKRPLTVADFAIPAKRIAIYVDGAAFHQGENLRRDRFIRQKLRQAEPPWTVVELTARDLSTGLTPLQSLFGSFPQAPDPEPTYEVDETTTTPHHSAPQEEPSTADEFPGYEILNEIGGGGMARCLKVRRRDSGETLFLKCVRTGSHDAQALQRELDVYDRLTRLEGAEHLLNIRETVRGDDQIALVTEYADGGDLRYFVEERGGKGLPANEALVIARQIASGLQELLAADVVHRDLKPENVLRAAGRWKLADFGIAKSRSRVAPGVTFQQAGTYGYAAPEQLEGVTAEPSADVYSFGKVLTFMLTGSTDPDRIRVEFADIRKLVQKCVQYAPNARPTIREIQSILGTLTGSA